MALRARKVSGALKKRAPGVKLMSWSNKRTAYPHQSSRNALSVLPSTAWNHLVLSLTRGKLWLETQGRERAVSDIGRVTSISTEPDFRREQI